MWLFGRQHTPIHLPEKTPRLSVSEAIIISRTGLTPQQWDRLTPEERADYRWRIGISA